VRQSVDVVGDPVGGEAVSDEVVQFLQRGQRIERI
jgi:hypothetical protein